MLHLNSSIPFLTLLKRNEIVKQMIDKRIHIGKLEAGFTECRSSCDTSRLFSNTKRNQRVESTE